MSLHLLYWIRLYFFLRNGELDKTAFLCFTLTSGGDLYFLFFFLQNAVIEC